MIRKVSRGVEELPRVQEGEHEGGQGVTETSGGRQTEEKSEVLVEGNSTFSGGHCCEYPFKLIQSKHPIKGSRVLSLSVASR